MNPLAITMFSQRKLNTYSVESPCKRLPRVGSFLANPGLSEVQRLQRCVVSAFVLTDIFIEILAHFAIYLFARYPLLYYKMNISTP